MMQLRETLYTLLCLMMGAYALSGCIDEYEADISAENTDLLVVEGTICSSRLCTFILSRTQSINSSATPRMVTGAKVTVKGTDGTVYQAMEADGYYACQIGSLSPDVEYCLHIEADSEVYESDPSKPISTEKIDSVVGVQSTQGSNVDVLITPAEPFDPSQARYYSWTYDETYQVYPDYRTTMYFDTEKGEPVYKDIYHFPHYGWVDATSTDIIVGASTGYDGQHIQNLKIYDLARDNIRLYYRYSGLVHQRAISKAEYESELARRQAGSEMGGLFTPLPSTLPTNIHCLTSSKRVIGFVGCSMNISEYRFFLSGEDFSTYRPSGTDTRMWLDGPTVEDCCKMVERGLYLCEWILPDASPTGKLRAAWASISQLDVRYRYEGAYIEEPDFWSLGGN